MESRKHARRGPRFRSSKRAESEGFECKEEGPEAYARRRAEGTRKGPRAKLKGGPIGLGSRRRAEGLKKRRPSVRKEAKGFNDSPKKRPRIRKGGPRA